MHSCQLTLQLKATHSMSIRDITGLADASRLYASCGHHNFICRKEMPLHHASLQLQ